MPASTFTEACRRAVKCTKKNGNLLTPIDVGGAPWMADAVDPKQFIGEPVRGRRP